ncbi:hypothetical protein NL676_028582 [Syzygium grande]|nr:hypothetical protein NL676_028582 [Syzygium grande]
MGPAHAETWRYTTRLVVLVVRPRGAASRLDLRGGERDRELVEELKHRSDIQQMWQRSGNKRYRRETSADVVGIERSTGSGSVELVVST